MNEDDWLNEPAPDYPVAKPDEGKPADALQPGLPVTESALAAAVSAQEKRTQFVTAWAQLTEHQKIWLNTWRESRFNNARTMRVLQGTAVPASKTTLSRWRESPGFEYVEKMLRSASVEEILSRDYLTARHEDIVETAMTPTPILHQGVATGHFEVELGVAQKANETLLKLGGHLKDKDIDITLGVAAEFVVQVIQRDGSTVNVAPSYITVDPAVVDTEWLDG